MATDTVTLTQKKPLMLVGIDDSDHSFYALEWVLDHFFVPHAPNFPFELCVVHAKPSPVSVIGLVGPSAAEVVKSLDEDLRRSATRIVDKVKKLCDSKSVLHIRVETWEGDARTILCEAVEKDHASMLVIGNHGYGAIKRAVLGSVSDYCSHHAHCPVMIVKKPKPSH